MCVHVCTSMCARMRMQVHVHTRAHSHDQDGACVPSTIEGTSSGPTWELLVTLGSRVFEEVDGLDEREPGGNVVRILVNLMDEGLELADGLLAPRYVVRNACGGREGQRTE